MKKLKRSLALALVVCMLCGFLPVGVFAAEATAPTTSLSTTGSPFQKGTGESNSFRIPALVTLSDGTLVAAADARWNTTYDGGGLDTMVAVSTDNGASWTHSFANYLGDNGNQYNGSSSSCFIDPALAVLTKDENNDGVGEDTIYMLVDLYPYGIALNGSGNTAPNTDTGFTDDGYLKLDYNSAGTYGYYLKDGEIYANGSSTPLNGYTVDAYFNVTNNNVTPATTTNLFFADSIFKVARTGFLYLTKSTDKGATWSAPQLLNLKNAGEQVCLVGPGRGAVVYNNEKPYIIFPVYSYNSGTQRVGFIYSADGTNWERSENLDYNWGSESAVVELWDNTLRFFFRNGSGKLMYVDYTWDNGWGTPQTTGIATNSNTQISAISLLKTIDDQQVILVSCPTGPNGNGSTSSSGSNRVNGKIFLFTVNGDTGAMTKRGEVSVDSKNSDTNYFMYSCLSALVDKDGNETGDIAILYEDNENNYGTSATSYYEMSFETVKSTAFGVTLDEDTNTDIDTETPGETYENNVTVKLGETFTETVEDIYVESGSTANDYVTVTWTGTQATSSYATATLGTDSSYNGAPIDVADCLYTFTASGNGFVVQSKSNPALYLNTTKNAAGCPNANVSNTVLVGAGNGTNTFYLHCDPQTGDNTESTGYLYFWHDGKNRFDRNSNTNNVGAQCSFYLYRPAKAGETGSTEIPGYIRVTDAYNAIADGDYLIAHEYNGAYYLLHPSTTTTGNDAGRYPHVAKVTGQTTGTDAAGSTTVTITGKKAGQTTVDIGNGAISYNVTVEQGASVDVQLKVNESKNYTIDGANHEKNITQQPDSNIVTMNVDGTDAVTDIQLNPVTTKDGLVAGKQYVIECMRAAKSGHAAYQPDHSVLTATEDGNGLMMDGPRNAETSQFWQIVPNGDNFQIKCNDEFLTLANNKASMEGNESNLTFEYSANNGWLIYQNGYYLSDLYGTGNTRAFGYNQRNDDGNYWTIYEVVDNSTTASTTVSFTGKAVGRTTAVVGDTTYSITVLPENVANTVEIEVEVGKTYTHTDTSGNHKDNVSLQPNASIATMTVTGTDAVNGTKSLKEITSTDGLVAGKQYLILNIRENGLLTDEPITDNYWDGNNYTGLKTEGAATVDSTELWTYTANGGLMQNGKYLTFGDKTAGTTGTETSLTLDYTENRGWRIIYNNRYLTDMWGNSMNGVYGYNDNNASTATDGGNYFRIYEIVDTSVTASTSITFKGVSAGTTTAVVGNTQYNITVSPAVNAVVNIELEIGESFTYTDTTGNYVNNVEQKPDSAKATMTVAGTSNSNVKKLVPVTSSTFESGKRYVIQSVRAANPNHAAYQPENSVLTSTAATGGYTGLVMNGPLDVNTSQTWVFTPSDNMYYIGRDNEYINISDGNATMETSAQQLSLEYVENKGWLIYYNQDGNNTSNDGDYFLSDVEGADRGEAFGYTTKNDDGNYWNIYEVVTEEVIDSTGVTFTGVAEGKTTAVVGTTQYNITVVPAEVDDEVMNSATDIWTVDPEVQRQRYNTIINGKYKDLYTDESWKEYETARQAAYKKLVEVINKQYESQTAAQAALDELKTLVDALDAAAKKLVAATTISVHYTYNGTELDIREYKIASSETSVTLPDTIVVEDIAYKVTNTTLERQGEETSYYVPVELIGKVGEGFVGSQDLNVGTHNGHAQIADLVDDDGNGKKITEMTVTVGISYDLDLGIEMKDGYIVEWVSDNTDIVTVDQAGNVTAVGEGITSITATVKDAAGNIVEVNSIPVTVFPTGTDDRNTAIYIEEVTNTTVWCVVNANTNTYGFEVIEGELIYGQFDTTVSDGTKTTAMSFFGDPDEAHALVYMKSTNSDDHYFQLHDKDGNMGEGVAGYLDGKAQYYYVSNTSSGAGYWQALGLNDNRNPDWDKIKDMVQWAINLGCDGGLGFTRRQTEGDLASNLSFKSDPMPRIEKVVDGVLPVTGKYANYRRYEENMTAAVHELVYFRITITQEVPTEWKDANQTEGAIEYTNAWVKDTVLPGAYLYTKELDQADGTWDGEIAEASRTQEDDVTEELNRAWTEEEKAAGQRIFEYYLRYEIQESDIPKFWIDNIANLTYNYESHYSTGAQAAAADAEARISVVGSAIDNVVIDFGQPFTYQGHTFTSITDGQQYTFKGLTNTHLKGAYVDGTYDANGVYTEGENDLESVTASKVVCKYGTATVTRRATGEKDSKGYPLYEYTVIYTPTAILKQPDVVAIYGMGENDQEKVINSFFVYPATTVYYEEGFMLNEDSTWDNTNAKKASTEQAFELLGMTLYDEHGMPLGTVSNKKNAYGYDGLHANNAYIESSATEKVIGDSTTFDFTGTGFDLYANCTDGTGYVAVLVKNSAGKFVKMYTVDTVAMKGTTAATKDYTIQEDSLPIVSVDLGTHDTYTVTITKIMDEEPVILDGIRIHNTVADTAIFEIDREDNPEFYQLRDYVLDVVDVNDIAGAEYGEDWMSEKNTLIGPLVEQVYGTISTDSEAPAAVVTSVTAIYSDEETAMDLLNNGPKNELFLFPDQTLSFNVSTSRAMQLGLKAPRNDTSYTLTYTVDNVAQYVADNKALTASEDMFYELGNRIGTETTYLVSITNTGSDIISITDLKICDDPNAAFVPLTEEDIEQILKDSLGVEQVPEEPEIQMPFADVPEDSFYYESVLWAVKEGITNGVTAEHFGPDAACNRAQVVTFLWRAAGSPEPNASKHGFVDVASGSFYEKAVLWAVENGITNGIDATHFSPDMECNRAQVVTFLYRASENAEAVNAENPFSDVPAESWFTDAVLWAVEEEITNGMGGGVFGVENICNRAQIVTFLYRAYN